VEAVPSSKHLKHLLNYWKHISEDNLLKTQFYALQPQAETTYWFTTPEMNSM
jgi:hypothetical protein